MRKIFVTGISTDVGKTLVSAILTEALEADYWKPVQTGAELDADSLHIKNLVSNNKTSIHKEAYHLPQPLSPHTAAELNGSVISLSQINLPVCKNKTLIIEGAGGLLVPLNEKEFVIDILEKFNTETVLVVRNYLGSINHTLLSVNFMKSRNINILGIIFNGKSNPSSENLILNYTGLKCLGRIEEENEINKEVVLKYSNLFKQL